MLRGIMNSCLIVIQNLTRSGSPQTFLHVIEVLNKRGFVVDAFVYAVRDKATDLYFYDKYKKACRNVFFQKMKLNGISYKLFPFTKFNKIKRAIRKNRYNLVISNNIYFMADCSAHKRKVNNAKLIFYALGNVNIQSKFAIIRRKERFVRQFIKGVDAYVAISSVAIPKDNIAPKDRLYILMDYPDNAFPEIVKTPIHDEIVLGQIGYYCLNKNQLFSLSLLKELLDRGLKARLVFIGFKLSEEPKYYDEMKEFINKFNLNHAVTLLSSDYDKKLFFENIHILLMPSYHEGLPITLLEAQLSNTYCLISDSITRDADFGLCSFSKLNKEDWINDILTIKEKKDFKPSRFYGSKEFLNSFSLVIDDVMSGKKI